MSDANDPAYPVVADNGVAFAASFRGLTKREAFAMAAMQGMLANENSPANATSGHSTAANYAELAAVLADALLAALKE